MESRYLTVKEVARYFRVSERTIYNWVEAGYLRAIKVYGEGTKGTLRIPREAVEEFERIHYTLPPEVPLNRKGF